MDKPVSLEEYVEGLSGCLRGLDLGRVRRIGDLLLEARDGGRRVFLFGNGGSAAAASHFAADLNKGLSAGGAKRFRAICLSDNVPSVTAWANDSDYADIFKEQMENFLEPGDVAFAISASGNSENVIRAVEFAAGRGAVTVGLCGMGGGRLKDAVSCALVVGSGVMEQVEDVHSCVCHMLKIYLLGRASEKNLR